MQKILIEVSYEDQKFVENECDEKGLTISIFFKNLLENYKKNELKSKKNKKTIK